MFCFDIKYKVLQINRLFCLIVFEILLFSESSFLLFGIILPHPREFDHQVLIPHQELDKKICLGSRDLTEQEIFLGVARGM